MDLLTAIKEEIEGVLNHVDQKELEHAAALFNKEQRVFVDGEGRSGLMAKGFAMRLMHLGYQVYVIGETITPAIEEGDLLVSVSGSGTSVNGLHNVSKAIDKGAEVIGVTSKKDTPLAKAASHALIVPGTVRDDKGDTRGSIQLLSTLFDQSLHITLDTLCLMISIKDNTSNDTATKGHW